MSEEKKLPQEKQPSAQPSVEYKQPQGGLPSIYSNNVAISPNSYDLRLYFGELAQATPEKVTINQQVEIVVSWVEAKVLAAFIQSHVDAFEKKNGTIQFPLMPDPPAPVNPFTDQGVPIQPIPTVKQP